MKKLFITVFFLALALCTFICVASAQEAYLEPIPENLLFEDDTVTHFIVFDDEKYYKGSGSELYALNMDNIASALEDLGVSESDLGKTYLTKFVFPAYLDGNLITFVNVNQKGSNCIKTTKYFNGKCGYVKFPGTMTTTHDMNQCVSQLRGIDFGENSQLIVIPYCFVSNASKLKEVKNFPTAQLDTIEADAFNGTKYGFTGELVINARIVGTSAFNNATTFVTSLVFGENVETLQNQSFSVRASETGLGNPLEFKCDVASITTNSYGPFYFELGGNSRSEYTSLKCIILSNETNKTAIANGATTFDDIAPNSYIRFFLDTTKEVVYTSHNVSYENATISYKSFLENGALTGTCTRCGKQESIDTAPLFTFNGYSVPEDGRIEIYVGFTVNHDAVSKYEELTGNTVDFGIVAGAKKVLGDKAPLDENGNAIILNDGMVIKASARGEFDSYELRITGFTSEEQKDAYLLMASYVHILDEDGKTVSVDYLQASQVKDNNFVYVSYNSYGQ